MSNGVRTAVVVVCGLFIVVLAQAGCQCKPRARMGGGCSGFQGCWGYGSGSEARRERERRPCGAAARADAISRKQRGLAASPSGEP